MEREKSIESYEINMEMEKMYYVKKQELPEMLPILFLLLISHTQIATTNFL